LRRIHVELPDEARQRAGGFYAEHAELAESLYKRYTEEQIAFLLDFVKQGREFHA
jgi:hypothetical protein